MGLHGKRRWVLASAVALTLLGALALAEWAGWPFLRLPLARQLSQVAATEVTLAPPFRVRLLGSPRLSTARLSVAAAAGSAAPFLLNADDVQLSLRWSDLWAAARGRGVRVRELVAGSLQANLWRDINGRATWQIGAKPVSASVAPSAPPSAPLPAPVLERLSVRQAEVRVDDLPLALRLNLKVAELAASSVSTGLPVRITAEGSFQRAAVRAQVDIDNMLLLFGQDLAPRQAAHVDGQAFVGRAMLKFAGEVGGLAAAPALQGEFTAKGPSLGLVLEPLGMTMPQTPPFFLQGALGLTGSVWQVQAKRMEVGSSRLAGRFAFDTARQPAHLSGQLTGSRLALQDLGPSIGVQAPASERSRVPRDKVLPDKVLDIPSLNAMDANIDVAIDSLDFGSAAVAPLSRLRTALTLHEGVLKFDKLSAEVAGGTVRGSTSLQAKGAQARWQAALQFDRIALAKWLRPLQAKAPVAGQPAPVPLASGALTARVALTGQGRSVAEILGAADGQLQASLTGGTLSHLVTELAGLDVAQALGVAIRGDRSLSLRCARVQGPVKKGVLGPVQGLVENSDSVLTVDGSIDLRSEKMDLRLVTRPKDFSPLSLRSPVHVRGSLSQASLSVEPGPIAARVLGALAMGAVAPLLAWLPLFETGDAEQGNPCAASTRTAQAAVKTAPTRP